MHSSHETPLTERQSLDLIQTMIRQAQNRLTDDGSHLIWWGLVVGTAAFGHYALLRTAWAEHAGMAWLLLLVGGVGAAVIGWRQARTQRAKTFVDRVMGGLWASVGTAIGLIFWLAAITDSVRMIYPGIMTLYGIGLLTSAAVVRFRPLLVAGLLCWVMAVTAAALPFEGQLLCLGTAAMGGFLLPGLLVRSKFQNQQAAVLPDAARAV